MRCAGHAQVEEQTVAQLQTVVAVEHAEADRHPVNGLSEQLVLGIHRFRAGDSNRCRPAWPVALWIGACSTPPRSARWSRSVIGCPPSGANSVAFYVPDMLLGIGRQVRGYGIHMLDRLPVMSDGDQERFWRIETARSADLSRILCEQIDGHDAGCEQQLDRAENKSSLQSVLRATPVWSL